MQFSSKNKYGNFPGIQYDLNNKNTNWFQVLTFYILKKTKKDSGAKKNLKKVQTMY